MSLRHALAAWQARVLDLVYPRYCAGCGGATGDEHDYFCWNCKAELSFISLPYCAVCGNPVSGMVDAEYTCYPCSEKRPAFDQARSVARFRGRLRQLIHDFKYNQAVWLRRDLARLLVSGVSTFFDPAGLDLVAPVPLYPARQRQRSYNQSQLLAENLARHFRIPLKGNLLLRTRPTATQTHLTAEERATNVRGAFRVHDRDRPEGRSILLVDDVMTTGATVGECARVLKAAGAAQVLVITVARN